MKLDLIMKINSNPLAKKYLRENAYWYKYLNRSDIYYQEFIREMKEKYQLTNTDKIKKIVNDINTFKAFLDIIK